MLPGSRGSVALRNAQGAGNKRNNLGRLGLRWLFRFPGLLAYLGQTVAEKLQSSNGAVEAGAVGFQFGETLGIAQGHLTG